MPKTIYYGYRVRFLLTDQSYVGIQYAVGCSPENLWQSYFTISKVVKTLIEEHGKDAFTFEIRKIFKNAEDTRRWEYRILTRLDVVNNPKWLNCGNWKVHGVGGMKGKKHNDETKNKISKELTGRKLSEETKQKIAKASQDCTKETRAKLSIAGKNRILSLTHKQRISDAHKKRYRDGNTNPNKGKPMSQLQKDKISKSIKDWHAANRPAS